METSGVPVQRLEPGRVLSETFSLYRDNLGPLLGSALIVFAIFELLSLLLFEADVGIVLALFVIELVSQALYTGIVVKLVEDVRDGRRDSTVRDLFFAVAPAIFTLGVFSFLYTLGTAVGFLLLVVPGLILVTIWSLGPPAIVIERTGPIEAFGRSQELVKGSGWSVFIVVILTFVIALAVSFGLTVAAEAIAEGNAAGYLTNVLASTLTAPISALAVAIMYFALRERHAAEPAKIA